MERSVGDRLATHRRRRFVGRLRELELFDTALSAFRPDFAVLYVHGPGGVGKSALLRMFADRAEAAGRAVLRVDGHEVRPNSSALLAVLGPAPDGPAVVMIDTYELLESVDPWLREEYLPELRDDILVVVAGRNPPAAGWSADPAWRDLLRTVDLTDLDSDEASAVLAAAGVPPELRASTVTATHGHPLALMLVIDLFAQRGSDALGEAALSDPDVLGVLVARLVEEAPDRLHRHGLAISALARVTTEALLRDVLDLDDAHELFDWLHRLSCMEAGPRGLYPHDLARDVLEADLRWRDQGLHQNLRRRIRTHTQRRIRIGRNETRQEAIYDLIFTTRNDPVSRHFSRWETLGSAAPEPVTPADLPDVLALVAQHEGSASADIAAHWYHAQPEAFVLYRERGVIGGLHVLLVPTATEPTDIRSDPVTAAVWAHIQQRRPLQDGDEVMVQRFMIDRRLGRAPSPASDLASMRALTMVASRPQLAWDVIATADPDHWAPQYTVLGFTRVPPPDPVVGDVRVGLFMRDARQTSPMHDPLRPTAAEGGHDLTRTEFDAAVRDALRDLVRVDLLARNPLLTTRTVLAAGGDPDGLRAVVVAAADVLREHPRDTKLHRAIDRTYLRPAPTQELAAEVLGLPFSTYRRHLTQGIARIADLLWIREASSK